MGTLDLWGDVLENNMSAEHVLTFLKEQASLLAEKTGNKVCAKFEQVKYTYKSSNMSGIATILSTIGTSMASFRDVSGAKVEIDANLDLEDASSFFQEADYKFEINSSKYKFRVFTLNYKSIFPISLDVEYGILDNRSTKLTINDMDELEKYLGDILSSPKVKFIIGKMLEETIE